MIRDERPERSDVPNKDAIRGVRFPAALQVTKHGVADVLRKRQPNFVSTLAQYPQRSACPFDVSKSKSNHITRTKPEPHQQKNDCTVTSAAGGTAITGSDEP